MKKPSFLFNYWKPWKEDSNVFDSFLEYSKDTQLVEYSSQIVGKYIKNASENQIKSIQNLSKKIGRGLDFISYQLEDLNENLFFINRNLDQIVEQEIIANNNLNDIFELIRIPETEKERQHLIEQGLHFYEIAVSQNNEFYADSLKYLHEAEKIKKDDFFVNHRLGYVYLFSKTHINPKLALEYFSKSAKYSEVEIDQEYREKESILTKRSDVVNTKIDVTYIASDSFEKAALSAYILGFFEEAYIYQGKSYLIYPSVKNGYLLSKYATRHGEVSKAVEVLNDVIESAPEILPAVFKDIDLINEKKIQELIEKKNEEVNQKLKEAKKTWGELEWTDSQTKFKNLPNKLLKSTYEDKVAGLIEIKSIINKVNSTLDDIEDKIDDLIKKIKKSNFLSLTKNDCQNIIAELIKAKDLNADEGLSVLKKYLNIITQEEIKIGSRYKGGIVYYVEDNGHKGMICAEKDLGQSIWGCHGDIKVNFQKNPLQSKDGPDMDIHFEKSLIYTLRIATYASKDLQLKWNGIKILDTNNAAKMCLEFNKNGFAKWHLPSIEQLRLIQKLGVIKKETNYWACGHSSLSETYGFFVNSLGKGRVERFEKDRKHHVLPVCEWNTKENEKDVAFELKDVEIQNLMDYKIDNLELRAFWFEGLTILFLSVDMIFFTSGLLTSFVLAVAFVFYLFAWASHNGKYGKVTLYFVAFTVLVFIKEAYAGQDGYFDDNNPILNMKESYPFFIFLIIINTTVGLRQSFKGIMTLIDRMKLRSNAQKIFQ